MSIRPPAVAGMFYPDSEFDIARELDRCFNATDEPGKTDDVQQTPTPTVVGPPKALIVPHAGYIYSGITAAYGYRQLSADITRVVLLGPCHTVAVYGLALPGAEAFATPVGTVPVDTEQARALAGKPQVLTSPEAHRWEHSLEVQLPFLLRMLDQFTLLPLAVGAATPEDVADVLDTVWGGPETLIVISSDLSHYLPYELANKADAATVAPLRRMNFIYHKFYRRPFYVRYSQNAVDATAQ